jgi:hypothetical protein
MFYDIYGLSRKRDAATIERFLQHFCYRDQVEPLVNQWLQVWVKGTGFLDEVERPLTTVDELITYAIQHPTHCFVWYQQLALRGGIKAVITKFTYDGQIVFGISLAEGQVNGVDNFAWALQIEAEIRQLTEAHKHYIAVEYPPAGDEQEFDTDVAMWQQIRDDEISRLNRNTTR